MHNPRLIKRQGHWYLIDDTVSLEEGGVAIYDDTKPVFTNFIDEDNNICSIGFRSCQLHNLITVMGSTNQNDGTPMLDTSKFEELGVVDEKIDYSVDYTITFANGNQEAYLINRFVNILRVKKESN